MQKSLFELVLSAVRDESPHQTLFKKICKNSIAVRVLSAIFNSDLFEMDMLPDIEKTIRQFLKKHNISEKDVACSETHSEQLAAEIMSAICGDIHTSSRARMETMRLLRDVSPYRLLECLEPIRERKKEIDDEILMNAFAIIPKIFQGQPPAAFAIYCDAYFN